MKLYQNQNAGVCKDNHLLPVSRLSQKVGHNLMRPQISEQGGVKGGQHRMVQSEMSIFLMGYLLFSNDFKNSISK